jgi:hypothetical protein
MRDYRRAMRKLKKCFLKVYKRLHIVEKEA